MKHLDQGRVDAEKKVHQVAKYHGTRKGGGQVPVVALGQVASTKICQQHIYDGHIEHPNGVDALTWFSKNVFELAKHKDIILVRY